MNIRPYAQLKQDIKILELLNQKTNGYFLDIGCANVQRFSNTYLLETEFNWNGLCVDPRPEILPGFQRRRKCFFKNAAVYTHTGSIRFRDRGMLSGIDDDTITDSCGPRKFKKDQKVYEVPCITLKDLFEEYKVPSVIDYMSLDVEGAELLILETFPFSTHTLLTATIEHNAFLGPIQKEKAIRIVELMKNNNFDLVEDVSHDFVFANRGLLNR